MEKYWAVACPDSKSKNNAGLWKTWFEEECVAIGGSPDLGNRLEGEDSGDTGFDGAKKVAAGMSVGDVVVPR